MLSGNAFVLYRHIPAAKSHHPSFEILVLLKQRSLLEFNLRHEFASSQYEAFNLTSFRVLKRVPLVPLVLIFRPSSKLETLCATASFIVADLL